MNRNRRRFIAGAGALCAAPWVARAAGEQVLVRTSGGSFQAAQEKAIFEPFTRATGIKVVPVPLSTGKLKEILETGRIPVDAQFLVETYQIDLEQGGLLEPIDYDAMRYTKPEDIAGSVRREYGVGAMFLATVLVYNTKAFGARAPHSWADFWDAKGFPGPRSLPDIKSGFVELEFALLADGVPPERLYPIDVERALRSLARIRRNVVAFWETGTEAMQQMERGNAVMGALWNGRAQELVDRGAPLAIDWHQAKRHNVMWCVHKGAPNRANAQRFIDFALQPSVAAHLARLSHYGPVNTKAQRLLPPEVVAKLPTAPEHMRQSFAEDSRWWSQNLASVTERWNAMMSRQDA
jgi:putative spermidine/putrescine transport system substrate-binding protein